MFVIILYHPCHHDQPPLSHGAALESRCSSWHVQLFKMTKPPSHFSPVPGESKVSVASAHGHSKLSSSRCCQLITRFPRHKKSRSNILKFHTLNLLHMVPRLHIEGLTWVPIKGGLRSFRTSQKESKTAPCPPPVARGAAKKSSFHS